MISAYQSIISFDGKNFVDFLEKISLLDTFSELVERYAEDRPLLQCIVKYIAMAYSKDSDKIIVDLEWLQNKLKIYDEAMLPPMENVRNDVIHLQEPSVSASIKKWLAIQDSDAFTQLQVLKDLKIEMQVSANSPIKKSSNEIDYDQKFKNAGYVSNLTQMIKALESELMQNDARFKEGIREVKQSKVRSTIGIELFAK